MLFINRSSSFSKSGLVATGINCFFSKHVTGLIPFGAASLVSRNSLSGNLGIRKSTVMVLGMMAWGSAGSVGPH